MIISAISISPADRESVAARFWAKVDRNGPVPAHRPELGPCWLWTGSVTPGGYGQLLVKGRLVQAHRVAWLLAEGEIPAGQCVCHHCDVRRCVRHAHHFLGTRQVNAQDMAQKGRAHLQRDPLGLSGARHWSRRHPKRFAGTRNPSAKLTEAQVVAIREAFAAGATYRALSAAYGISTGAIGFIVTGQHWPEVGGPRTTARRAPGPQRRTA